MDKRVSYEARQHVNDTLLLKLYGTQIQYEEHPKFLGIIFDRRLNFKSHSESMEEKINDRLNVLKILSFDESWRLNEKFLINA